MFMSKERACQRGTENAKLLSQELTWWVDKQPLWLEQRQTRERIEDEARRVPGT